jgi:hypothetical protein
MLSAFPKAAGLFDQVHQAAVGIQEAVARRLALLVRVPVVVVVAPDKKLRDLLDERLDFGALGRSARFFFLLRRWLTAQRILFSGGNTKKLEQLRDAPALPADIHIAVLEVCREPEFGRGYVQAIRIGADAGVLILGLGYIRAFIRAVPVVAGAVVEFLNLAEAVAVTMAESLTISRAVASSMLNATISGSSSQSLSEQTPVR